MIDDYSERQFEPGLILSARAPSGPPANSDEFWRFVNKRHRIWVRRDRGDPPPNLGLCDVAEVWSWRRFHIYIAHARC